MTVILIMQKMAGTCMGTELVCMRISCNSWSGVESYIYFWRIIL